MKIDRVDDGEDRVEDGEDGVDDGDDGILTMATMALKIASKNCQFASVEWADLNSRPN